MSFRIPIVLMSVFALSSSVILNAIQHPRHESKARVVWRYCLSFLPEGFWNPPKTIEGPQKTSRNTCSKPIKNPLKTCRKPTQTNLLGLAPFEPSCEQHPPWGVRNNVAKSSPPVHRASNGLVFRLGFKRSIHGRYGSWNYSDQFLTKIAHVTRNEYLFFLTKVKHEMSFVNHDSPCPTKVELLAQNP